MRATAGIWTNASITVLERPDGVEKLVLNDMEAQFVLKKIVDSTVSGPSEDLRTHSKSYIWGEVKNAQGKRLQAVIQTCEAYKLTAITAVAAAERVLNHEARTGFHTPSQAFGADFILEEVEGTSRRILSEEEYAQ